MSHKTFEILLEAFRRDPSLETLEGAVYAVLCNCHCGLYIPEDVQGFQTRRGYIVDCGESSGTLSQILQPELHTPLKAATAAFVCPGYEPWQEQQFVTFISAPDRQMPGRRVYFGVDQAAWFYSSEKPWFHIVEGPSVQSVLDGMIRYFRTETRPEPVRDRSGWKPLSGRAATLRFLEDQLTPE